MILSEIQKFPSRFKCQQFNKIGKNLSDQMIGTKKKTKNNSMKRKKTLKVKKMTMTECQNVFYKKTIVKSCNRKCQFIEIQLLDKSFLVW